MKQNATVFEDCDLPLLQREIDRTAESGGGTVIFPSGVFTLSNALCLKNGVRVIGSAGTVLRRMPSVASRLVDRVGYGHYEFTVEEPDLFPIGCGVHIYDDLAWGFYTTAATIVDRQDDLLFTDRPFSHDYSPTANGMVARLFSVVEGVDIHDASVANLTLDGNADETHTHDGCRGAGVFLLRTHRVEIDNIEIINFRGDAISFQACTDTLVREARLHHNKGIGIHPGSGSVRYELLSNHIHHNGEHGIFYCLRSSHSTCQANTIEHNGGCGISIGERDTHHLICKNTIFDNANAGIEFRPFARRGGDHVRVEENSIGSNCRVMGGHELTIATRHRDLHINSNTFMPAEKKKALSVEPGCAKIIMTDNTIRGEPLTSRDADVSGDSIFSTKSATVPDVGPGALAMDGARHLGVERLLPWQSHTSCTNVPSPQGSQI